MNYWCKDNIRYYVSQGTVAFINVLFDEHPETFFEQALGVS
jgi:hypothetical protein